MQRGCDAISDAISDACTDAISDACTDAISDACTDACAAFGGKRGLVHMHCVWRDVQLRVRLPYRLQRQRSV